MVRNCHNRGAPPRGNRRLRPWRGLGQALSILHNISQAKNVENKKLLHRPLTYHIWSLIDSWLMKLT